MWHNVIHKEDKSRMVYSRITGKSHAATKQEHYFVCVKCDKKKLKAMYNYAEVEKAMESREQPTCAPCLPDVPAQISKLEASEMNLYLKEWDCLPSQPGTKKKELQKIFQQACKCKLKKTFFKVERKARDMGVKEVFKPRNLQLNRKKKGASSKFFRANSNKKDY